MKLTLDDAQKIKDFLENNYIFGWTGNVDNIAKDLSEIEIVGQIEPQVSLGDSQPVPEPNHNCENCISLNKYDDKLSCCFCGKHGRFLSQFYNEDRYTLKDIGCNQFEQKL